MNVSAAYASMAAQSATFGGVPVTTKAWAPEEGEKLAKATGALKALFDAAPHRHNNGQRSLSLSRHFNVFYPAFRPSSIVAAVLDAVTGSDVAPRGRSFWYHRFVHELRKIMLQEPNVNVSVASYKALASNPRRRRATRPTHCRAKYRID